MVPLVPVTNLAMYVLGVVTLWIVVPAPPGNRLYRLRTGFDTSGVGRLGARLTGIIILAGLLVPAVLGWAPVSEWPLRSGTSLAGILYVPFFFAGVLLSSLMVGLLRVRRLLAASTNGDLRAPPTEGPALITATARDPTATAEDADLNSDVNLVHDYRLDLLIRGGIAEETERLKDTTPFLLDGPAGSIFVDTTGAHVALFGRDPEDRQIADGDEITVLGTVRTDSNGQYRISGADDLLYLSNETKAELWWRVRKGIYAGGFLGLVFLFIAGASLNALSDVV